jgi:hypothetical protein
VFNDTVVTVILAKAVVLRVLIKIWLIYVIKLLIYYVSLMNMFPSNETAVNVDRFALQNPVNDPKKQDK